MKRLRVLVERATRAGALLAAAPLVISHGGSYSGPFVSTEPNVPAITVHTSAPVTIENATITGPGPLIAGDVSHIKLTVRNVSGTGQNPNIAGTCAGRFLSLESFDSITVEHCTLDHTAGIYLRDFAGNASTTQPTIRILQNRATNIDGRCSDGHGGYLPFNRTVNLKTHASVNGFIERQFLQLDRVHAPGIEIGWNYVTNEPGDSRVEDNINLYNSGGTATRWVQVHDNCIRGAYTLRPATATSVKDFVRFDWSYSGGGIMLGDGSDRTAGAVSSFIQARSNVVIGTSNYGIAIAAGHDISITANTVVSSGRLPDETHIFARNVGIFIWDEYRGKALKPPVFFNSGGADNVAAWAGPDGRNDFWTPDAAYWKNNQSAASVPTTADERRAETGWLSRLAATGRTVGHAKLPR